jgi:hypothetical protein
MIVQRVEHNNKLLAIIIPHDSSAPGIHFVTPPHFSQQLALMNHQAGHRIGAHSHRRVERQVFYTQEVLFIRTGKVKVDFYDDAKSRIAGCELGSGDVIMLVSGGHGFEILEETEMVEVKQGPYLGDEDKIRYEKEESDNDGF